MSPDRRPMSFVLGRTLRRQWWVVLVLGLLAAGLAVAPNLTKAAEWQSTARVAVSDQAPRSAQEATALIASVRAVATSTRVVANALQATGLERDAATVAANNVAVNGLGASPIATVTVSDRDPDAARRLTAALTEQIVAEFTNQQTSGLQQLTNDLDKRIEQAQGVRARLVASFGALPTSKQRADLAELDAELNDLRSQRAAAARQLAGASQAYEIDPAGAPTKQQSPAIADGLLAFVIGALVGLALIAVRELIRPSIRGADELAMHFDAPVLGHLTEQRTDVAGLARVRQVAAQVALVAARGDVERVVVVGEPDESLVSEISVAVTQLLSVTSRQNGKAATVATPAEAQVRPRPVAAAAGGKGSSRPVAVTSVPRPAGAQKPPTTPVVEVVAPSRQLTFGTLDEFETPLLIASQRRVGVLVMTPGRISTKVLQPIEELLGATGWPVLGVLTYEPTSASKDDE